MIPKQLREIFIYKLLIMTADTVFSLYTATAVSDLLAKAAAKSIDDIYGYLSTTSYSSAVEALKTSPSAFEKWCDDKLIDSIKPQKSEPFTIGPLAAYIIARENEIKAVRLILSAKLNDLDSDAVNERLRDMYV